MALPRPAYDLLNPDATGPVILSVPHAARDYKPEMLALMRPPAERLVALEDRLVDEIARGVERAPVLIGRVPRAWIDLNRHEAELDPGLVEGIPPSRLMLTPKVRSGLGLIPRRLAGVGDIWRRRLTRADVEARIAGVHRPYHAAIGSLVARALAAHGVAVLLDLHSMPPLPQAPDAPRADIVIGDRFGQSAARWAICRLDATCRAHGLRAQENVPYAGGHIIERHARPTAGVHAVQLEIDRDLYLQPGHGHARADGLAAMRTLVQAAVDALGRAALDSALPLAAE